MSVDKLVDSTQLDSDLSSVADAIRAKSGGSSQLAFPSGFVSEIENISTGYTLEDVANGTYTGAVSFEGTTLRPAMFAGSSITSFGGPNVSGVISLNGEPGNVFENCTSLESVNLPKITNPCQKMFRNCTNLQSVWMPKATIIRPDSFLKTKIEVLVLPKCTIITNAFSNSQLKTLDFGKPVTIQASDAFRSSVPLQTIIFRSDSVSPLSNAANFTNAPYFGQGGAGGTIYIPKALYDHLGDGTSLDYKAATNWSTIDGYGTITWAKIEGSIYETQYADGTPIGS